MNLWYGKRTARLLVNDLVKEATGFDILARLDHSGFLPEGLNDKTANSVARFLLATCDIAPHQACDKNKLFQAYIDFCAAKNLTPLNSSRFGKEILANPAIGIARPRSGGKRKRHYTGLTLKPTPALNATIAAEVRV